jgi:hypothetical protein
MPKKRKPNPLELLRPVPADTPDKTGKMTTDELMELLGSVKLYPIDLQPIAPRPSPDKEKEG